MTTLHYDRKKCNRTNLLAAVGKGPERTTPFGISIDVVRIDVPERVWGDLVPTNPEIFGDLRPGVRIEVMDVEVIRLGRRPMWRGRVSLVER